jgi:CRP-like cAMP-binding protein
MENDQVPSEWVLNYLRQVETLMVIRSYRRVDVVLLKLLGWLAKRFGRTVNQGNLIDLRLTHQDLAELVGTTRVTITRTLGQFEEQGLIERLSVHRTLLKEYELWHYEI